ncbi:putative wall-associated receptor kinase-like 16 [Musa acuminata AAA Group]|uniref:putative wall-associated receptor kinase-like 16 n=1 Tax=Musa acuminata AAA Group TaxID=214697 RepID=UPI0031D93F8A
MSVLLGYRLFQLLMLPLVGAAASAAAAPPGCRRRCGEVDVPYPFGIDPNCSMEGFSLDCNKMDGHEKLFLSNVEITNISLPLGQARMLNEISWRCYNDSTKSMDSSFWYLNFVGTPYRFSDVHNKFTVIGCDTLAYIGGLNFGGLKGNGSYRSGCVSACQNEVSLDNSSSCSGIGCCQTSIPKDLAYYEVWFDSNFNSSSTWNFSDCSYAVLLEANQFEFLTSYITTTKFWHNRNGTAPLVMDWAIGNETCEVAQRNITSYACISEHSKCLNSSNGPGYLCNCSSGYHGNPYVAHGCQDIDECSDKDQNPCHGICQNLPGSYNCFCPRGTYGDAFNGTCTQHQKLPSSAKVAIGCSGLIFLLISGMCIYVILQRRKFIKIKERYFREHGGWILLEEIKAKERYFREQGLAFKIFVEEELEKATEKYDKNRVLGRGGHGTVYKGDSEDSRVVAIKKPKIIDESQKNEFGKELLILSQINHKNIVKLLGCCLEVEVPMLVYEFVSNGTLFQLIHDNNRASPFSLATRLRIAHESAEALAYLHSSASPPIIHGDVKSSNILLDENYTAKVSDFGASKLVPKDEDQFATLVQGTCGYLDPEYLQTCQLTEKSDVYSFSIVLLELMTRKKPVCFEASEDERSLASCFIMATKENRLMEILDDQVRNEGDTELIQEMSELAKQCLKFLGEERPTMKQVTEELDRLRKLKQHPWVPQNTEESESLLSQPLVDHETYCHGIETTTSYNPEKRLALDIEHGR